MTMTGMAAMGGASMEAMETAAAVPVSTEKTTEFTISPVVEDGANRPAALALFMTVAVPPPATVAGHHAATGFKLAAVETTTTMPATLAKGIAEKSIRLSAQGMKWAEISTMVATTKAMSLGKSPIHCPFSLSSQIPKYIAKLSAKSYENTQKTHRCSQSHS